MERTTLEKFFTGKLLQVPPYQRDYAWEPANVDDLWNDLQEVFVLSISHYLGTFILANPGQGAVHDIVDGQQRLTTLTMLAEKHWSIAFPLRLNASSQKNVTSATPRETTG